MTTVSTAKAQVRVHIRWLIRRDHPEVLAIERASAMFPWCEDELAQVLRERNCIGMVAEYTGRVVGFMIYSMHRDRIKVFDFAVAPEFRRQGIGHQMMVKLVGKLSSHRRTRIILHIRETNLGAQMFCKVHGFKATRVLREWYEDTGEDVYIMEYCMDESVTDDQAGLPVNCMIKPYEA